MLSSLFPGSRRRSKLTAARARASSIQQWTSKFEGIIQEIKLLLDMLDEKGLNEEDFLTAHT